MITEIDLPYVMETMQRLYDYRSAIGNAAIEAVEIYIRKAINTLQLGTPDAIRLYVKEQLYGDAQVKMPYLYARRVVDETTKTEVSP